MDPNECLRLLIAAIARGDKAEAKEHRENLVEWIKKGGFEPDWGKHREVKRMIKARVRSTLVVELDVEAYQRHTENYDGYCLSCSTFTVGGCEPDLHNAKCPDCGRMTLFGTEELLMQGLIKIKEDA